MRRLCAVLLPAFLAVQLIGLAVADANAPNPDPTTMGTAVVNADGTVSANLSGTWSWPGQNCAGRYGEDWSVDWWGISSSPTPNPSFSLTNATEETGPGVSAIGTISPAGSIKLRNANTYFHVARYYAGETVNSAATCTDTVSGKTKGSTGTWSAAATYPSLSDVPAQVCAIQYDPHGKEGRPSTSAKDYDPVHNSDNSIQTNAFDPSAGSGYCVALHVITQTIQGEIYKCVNGNPTTTLIGAGTINVSPGSVSSANPLAPTHVAAGNYTVAASLPSGQHFVACGQSGVTISTPGSAHQPVTVPSGGSGDGKFYAEPDASAPGYVEICKSAANGVTGTFEFAVNGKKVYVPAGACSPAIQVPSGQLAITESWHLGYYLASASTNPSNRLVSVDKANQRVTVTIVAGNISTQTIVTFVNAPVQGTVKVCQVAGSGVAVGTQFTFTNSANSQVVQVPAGPSPGGYCVVLDGTFVGGTNLTVDQNVPANDAVTSITVGPENRLVGTPDLAHGNVTVTVGSGVTEIVFTDQRVS